MRLWAEIEVQRARKPVEKLRALGELLSEPLDPELVSFFRRVRLAELIAPAVWVPHYHLRVRIEQPGYKYGYEEYACVDRGCPLVA